MLRKIQYEHISECPYTGELQSIDVTYTEVPLLGQMSPGYKITGCSCPYSGECPYPSQSTSGACPVLDTAPEQPC